MLGSLNLRIKKVQISVGERLANVDQAKIYLPFFSWIHNFEDET